MSQPEPLSYDKTHLSLHTSCSPASVINKSQIQTAGLLHCRTDGGGESKCFCWVEVLLPLNCYTQQSDTSAKPGLMRRCQSEREQQLLPTNSGSGKGSRVSPEFTVTELALLHCLHHSDKTEQSPSHLSLCYVINKDPTSIPPEQNT